MMKRPTPWTHRAVELAAFIFLTLFLSLTNGFASTTRSKPACKAFICPEAWSIHCKNRKSSHLAQRHSSSKIFYHDGDNKDDHERRRTELTKSFLKATRLSFKNFEGATDSLLDKNPFIALMIFVGLGLFVAYISGFAILDGYIDSSNPMDNGVVPYWDEDISSPLLPELVE